MTSYQPGEPSYVAPQDPWSGAQGVSSPPTDPIPAPPRGVFAPGKATPVAPVPNAWQETVAHDQGYRVQERPPRRIGLYLFVTVLVLVLGGAGGYGAWYLITENFGSSTATPTPTLTPFRSTDVKVNDCILEVGQPSSPTGTTFQLVACGSPDARPVLKLQIGDQLAALGGLTDEVASTVCLGVEGLDAWATWDAVRDEEDAVFCLGAATPTA